MVDLEKKLMQEEKQEFQGRQFALEDVRNFREGAGNVDYGGAMNPPCIPKGHVIRKLST